MRKNRKRRNGRLLNMGRKGFAAFLAVIMLLVAEGITYLAINDRCNVIMADIRALENEQGAIKKEWKSEQCRWAECTDPRRLEQCLVRHGLNMELAGGEQIVKIGADAFAGPKTRLAVYASNRRP